MARRLGHRRPGWLPRRQQRQRPRHLEPPAAPQARPPGPPAATAPLHAPERKPATANYTPSNVVTPVRDQVRKNRDGHASLPCASTRRPQTHHPARRPQAHRPRPDHVPAGSHHPQDGHTHHQHETADKSKTHHDKQPSQPAGTPTPSERENPPRPPSRPSPRPKHTTKATAGRCWPGAPAQCQPMIPTKRRPPGRGRGTSPAGGLLAGALWLLLHQRRRPNSGPPTRTDHWVEPAPGLAPVEKTSSAGAPTSDIASAVHNGLRRLAADLIEVGQTLPTVLSLYESPRTRSRRSSPTPVLRSAIVVQQAEEPTSGRSNATHCTGGPDRGGTRLPPCRSLVTVDGHDFVAMSSTLKPRSGLDQAGDPDFAADSARYLVSELGVNPGQETLLGRLHRSSPPRTRRTNSRASVPATTPRSSPSTVKKSAGGTHQRFPAATAGGNDRNRR